MGLWLNADRSERRKAYRVHRGVKGGMEALTNPIGFEWFLATSEDDEEAEANYQLHVSRFNFYRQQSDASSFLG